LIVTTVTLSCPAGGARGAVLSNLNPGKEETMKKAKKAGMAKAGKEAPIVRGKRAKAGANKKY
jgi:hypothetical protein